MSKCWVLLKKGKRILQPIHSLPHITKVPPQIAQFPCKTAITLPSPVYLLSVQVNNTPIPIKILCDAVAFQSLLAEGVLPLSDDSTTDDYVLHRGAE